MGLKFHRIFLFGGIKMDEKEINKINNKNEKIAMKVSFISIILNTILSIIKFFSGIILSCPY